VHTGFEDIVLEVHLLNENNPFAIAKVGKLLEPGEIPRIEPGQVVLAQSIPDRALTTSRPGLRFPRLSVA
jgi:hypothetical protein